MLDNLLLNSNNKVKGYYNNKIKFYKGMKSSDEKRFEKGINNEKIDNFINLYPFEYLFKKDDYTICFGFAPIYSFTNTDLFKRCLVTVLGHVYNTTHFNDKGNVDNHVTLKYLDKIKTETNLILYINNHITYNESKQIQKGQIVVNNMKMCSLLARSTNNGNKKVHPLLLQGLYERILFVYDKIKIIVNYENLYNDIKEIVL